MIQVTMLSTGGKEQRKQIDLLKDSTQLVDVGFKLITSRSQVLYSNHMANDDSQIANKISNFTH